LGKGERGISERVQGARSFTLPVARIAFLLATLIVGVPANNLPKLMSLLFCHLIFFAFDFRRGS
jgi:hypothetical protein